MANIQGPTTTATVRPGAPVQPPQAQPVQSVLPKKDEWTEFYSFPAAGLMLHVNHGQFMQVQGEQGMRRIGEKIVRFSPLNNTENGGFPYGYFRTKDKEVIDFLLRRATNEKDVLTKEQFLIHVARQPGGGQERTITLQNELIAKLIAEKAQNDKQEQKAGG